MEKVIFLDRDGTINEEVNYLYQPQDLILIPDAAAAIRQWNELGFKVVVVTNQAGVARGYYTEQHVILLHEYLNEQLKLQGAHIDLFFYCPHHPVYGIGSYQTACTCRKPNPGMLFKAEDYFQVDKARSYMIGDKIADIEAGANYGVKSILVGTGYGAEVKEGAQYDFYAENLMDAVRWIAEREEKYAAD